MTGGWQARPVSEFKDVSLRDLLGLHAGIMDELRRRGVARSANNPTGSLEHDAIVELDTWQAVRNLLAQNAVGRTRKTNVRGSFLLTGKVFDENGDPLYLSQAHAHGRRYGYYIPRHLMHGAHRNAEGWRIPARTLEHVVTASLSDLCRSQPRLMGLMSPEEPGIAALTGLKARAAGLSAQLSNGPLEEHVDPDLCRLIAQAHLWFDQLASGEACTVREIAGRKKINEHEITRVLHLAFL